ncbi:MAG: hypothetical protein OXB96_02555 [Candidatus Kaiserbacteria bacterium]|nr:hypothetical protein [Candidatus Kaiserbacteria bacterium]
MLLLKLIISFFLLAEERVTHIPTQLFHLTLLIHYRSTTTRA